MLRLGIERMRGSTTEAMNDNEYTPPRAPVQCGETSVLNETILTLWPPLPSAARRLRQIEFYAVFGVRNHPGG